MNKKELLSNLNNVNLTPEELTLLIKLNKRLVKLTDKINSYFSERETISYDSIASAFLSGSDPEATAVQYAELVEQFRSLLTNIREKYQTDLIKQEEIASPIQEKNIVYQINKTLANIGQLRLGALKQKALSVAIDSREASAKDENKFEKAIKEYDLIIQELLISTMDNDSITLESSKNDIELLKRLEVERKPVVVMTTVKQKLFITALVVTTIIFLGVGLWAILR